MIIQQAASEGTFFAFMDISGFGRMQREEYTTKVAPLDKLLRKLSKEGRGWLHCSGGDSYLAGFPDGSDVFRFVSEASQAIAKDVSLPSIHTGIHWCADTVSERDISNAGWNLRHEAVIYAARLNELATKDEVLISKDAYIRLGTACPLGLTIQVQGIKEVQDQRNVFAWFPGEWGSCDTAVPLKQLGNYYCLSALLDFIWENGTWGKSLPKAISILQDNKGQADWAVGKEGSITFTAFALFFLRCAGIDIPAEMCRETRLFLKNITKPSGAIVPTGGGDPGDNMERLVRHHVTGLWALAEFVPSASAQMKGGVLESLTDGLRWLLGHEGLVHDTWIRREFRQCSSKMA